MNSDSQSQEELYEDFFNRNFYNEQYYDYQYRASLAEFESRFQQLWPFSEPDQAFY